MALTPGDRLGAYEILAPLGEGGMGVVVRARDTRLNREVALKVLPDSFAVDLDPSPGSGSPRASSRSDRLARFRREAQVLAALNHPNIAAIYGIEESDATGVRAIVMELVEGVELGDAIRSGRFAGAEGLTEARAVALQIASALEAAHEAGVVHRDLKPSNIKLRPDGTVKVLDFGLAKALEVGNSGNVMNSPTMTSPAATEAGMIMGTAAYMSPEQARGRPVDRRADVWAFGCVLYEMLTGTPAFARDSVTDMLAAITRDEPDWSARPDLPPDISRLLKRCLDKDPRTRLRDIGEARVALANEAQSEPSVPQMTGSAASPARTGLVTSVAAAFLVAAAASAATWWLVSGRQPAGGSSLVSTISRVTADSGLTTSPAVAPNGSLLAYASDRGGGSLNIWVQPLPDGDPVQVTRDEVDASAPHFSPDGSRIVYRSERDGGGIYVVPALGGQAQFVAAKAHSPRFSPNGTSIAYVSGGKAVPSELWVIDQAGAAPRRLASDLQNANGYAWSPDGAFLAAHGTRQTGDARVSDWWLVDVKTGASTGMAALDALRRANLGGAAEPGVWVGDEILFSASSGDVSSLWAVDVSADGRTVTGTPRRLTAGVGADLAPTVVRGADGLTVYYANRDQRANLYRVPLPGSPGGTGLERVTDAAARDMWPSLSADGRTLVFESNRSSGAGAWLRDLATGRETRLTSTGSGKYPTVSPDGERVAYMMTSEDSQSVVIRALGGGAVEALPNELSIMTWSWPARGILFGGRRPAQVVELVVVDPATRQVRPVLADFQQQGYYAHGQLSPDGRWASASEFVNADRARIMVFPFRDTPVPPAEWLPLTEDQATEEEHVWSPGNDAIYFVSDRDGTRCIWMRKLDAVTKRPVGVVESVLHLHGARRSMISTVAQPQRIALGGNALYFSVEEARGNIWKAIVEDR